MIIVYYSFTDNIKKFLNKINFKGKTLRLKKGDEIINESYLLISSTIGTGNIPDVVYKFIKNNYHYCIGSIGSGNKNWGKNYCKAVDLLYKYYNIPVLMKFELQGNDEDIKSFYRILHEKNYLGDYYNLNLDNLKYTY